MIYSQQQAMKGLLGEYGLNQKSSLPSSSTSTATMELVSQLTGHWTDYNYCHDFGYCQYRESSVFDPSLSFSAAQSDSQFTGQVNEFIEEDLRRLAEACDSLSGVIVAAESSGAMGASSLQAQIHLSDEYGKKGRLVFGFEDAVQVNHCQLEWAVPVNERESLLQFAHQLAALKDQNVSVMPLQRNESTTEAFDFSQPLSFTQGCSLLLMDALLEQEIPTCGSFASLLLHTPQRSLNLSFNSTFGPLNLPQWRKHALPSGTVVECVSQACFDMKPFAQRAQVALKYKTKLDVGEEVIEMLHDLKDATDFAID